MINDAMSLSQARQQLERMEEVVSTLLRDSSQLHPSQLALQIEGPMDVIEHLHREIDEYLGIQRARQLLEEQTTARS